MPDCHKCVHDGKRRRECLKCKGPCDGPNHHGRTHVSLDALADAGVDPTGGTPDIINEVDVHLGLVPPVERDPYPPGAHDFVCKLFDHVRAGRHGRVDQMLRRLVKAAPRHPLGTQSAPMRAQVRAAPCLRKNDPGTRVDRPEVVTSGHK